MPQGAPPPDDGVGSHRPAPAIGAPALGSWQPGARVSIVVPARDCQPELDRTLASLTSQTYPEALIDVVVVDDCSSPPLQLPSLRPRATKVLRLDDAENHGSGRARHAGALASSGEILLFVDADMVLDHRHLEAHARWHHAQPAALVLARKYFVDFGAISPSDIARAGTESSVEALLLGRRRTTHVWQEEFVGDRGDLACDLSDDFLAVVGASLSLPRRLYERAGGFRSFGLRGITDTEFGFRALTAGARLVWDPEALAYHQGARSFARRGDEIKRARSGLAANYLPIPMFRRSNTGRRWAVPMARVVVDADGAPAEHVQLTVDSVLASEITDLHVTIVSSNGLPSWLHDYFGDECRVDVREEPVRSGFPSPITARVSGGLAVRPDTMGRLVHELGSGAQSVVRTNPATLDGLGVEAWETRVLERAMRDEADLDRAASRDGGERWLDAGELGIEPVVVSVSKQGMLANAPAAPAF